MAMSSIMSSGSRTSATAGTRSSRWPVRWEAPGRRASILDGRTGERRSAIDFVIGDLGGTGLCGASLPGARGKQILLITSMLRQAANDAVPELTPPGSPHLARPIVNGEFFLWTFDGRKPERKGSPTPAEYYA